MLCSSRNSTRLRHSGGWLLKHRLSNNVGGVKHFLSVLVRAWISSIATSTMIPSSNSSVKRSGTPSQFLGVLLHTTAMFGLSRVRTESSHLLVIPLLAHHPEQLNG
jgi:hypothetical protein